MVAFMALLYAVYAASLLIDGVALATGAFPGGGSFAITVVPAIAGFVLFVVTGAIALLPKDLERRLHAWAAGPSRVAHLLDRGVAAPALAASGVRTAMDLIRERRPGAARGDRVVDLRHPRAVGDVPRLRHPAPAVGDLDVLLRRHARQPAAPAGWPRGASRAA